MVIRRPEVLRSFLVDEKERLEACYWLSEVDPTASHLEATIELTSHVERTHRNLVALSGYLSRLVGLTPLSLAEIERCAAAACAWP